MNREDYYVNYFYKITNLINGKFYYGVRTCRNCLPGQDPYMGSGKLISRSISKYGVKNFKKEILRICKTKEDAFDLERWIVSEDMVNNPMCYNLSKGGAGRMYESVMWITNGTDNTMINKDDFYIYQKDGWYSGYTNKNYVSKTNEYYIPKGTQNIPEAIRKENNKSMNTYIKMYYDKSIGYEEILRSDVPFYRFLGYKFYTEGYHRDSGPTTGRIEIINPETLIRKKIDPNFLEDYECQGYIRITEYRSINKLRKPDTAMVTIHKGDVEIRIYRSESKSYYENGWKRGTIKRPYSSRSKKNRVPSAKMRNLLSGKIKLIPISDIDNKLTSGEWEVVAKRWK